MRKFSILFRLGNGIWEINTMKTTSFIVAVALLLSVAVVTQAQDAVKPAAPALTKEMAAQHAVIKTAREKMQQNRTTFIANRKAAKAACQTAGAACDAAKAKFEAEKVTMKADQDSLRQAVEALRAAQQASRPTQGRKAPVAPVVTGK